MANGVPHHASPEDEGMPDLQEASAEDPSTGDGQGEMLPPRDHPQAAEEHGTTALEQREGESLGGRLSREQPEAEISDDNLMTDIGPDDGSSTVTDQDEPLAGRLVAPGGELSADETPEEVAADAGQDSGGFTAEEAAMHIEEEQV